MVIFACDHPSSTPCWPDGACLKKMILYEILDSSTVILDTQETLEHITSSSLAQANDKPAVLNNHPPCTSHASPLTFDLVGPPSQHQSSPLVPLSRSPMATTWVFPSATQPQSWRSAVNAAVVATSGLARLSTRSLLALLLVSSSSLLAATVYSHGSLVISSQLSSHLR